MFDGSTKNFFPRRSHQAERVTPPTTQPAEQQSSAGSVGESLRMLKQDSPKIAKRRVGNPGSLLEAAQQRNEAITRRGAYLDKMADELDASAARDPEGEMRTNVEKTLLELLPLYLDDFQREAGGDFNKFIQLLQKMLTDAVTGIETGSETRTNSAAKKAVREIVGRILADQTIIDEITRQLEEHYSQGVESLLAAFRETHPEPIADEAAEASFAELVSTAKRAGIPEIFLQARKAEILIQWHLEYTDLERNLEILRHELDEGSIEDLRTTFNEPDTRAFLSGIREHDQTLRSDMFTDRAREAWRIVARHQIEERLSRLAGSIEAWRQSIIDPSVTADSETAIEIYTTQTRRALTTELRMVATAIIGEKQTSELLQAFDAVVESNIATIFSDQATTAAAEGQADAFFTDQGQRLITTFRETHPAAIPDIEFERTFGEIMVLAAQQGIPRKYVEQLKEATAQEWSREYHDPARNSAFLETKAPELLESLRTIAEIPTVEGFLSRINELHNQIETGPIDEETRNAARILLTHQIEEYIKTLIQDIRGIERGTMISGRNAEIMILCHRTDFDRSLSTALGRVVGEAPAFQLLRRLNKAIATAQKDPQIGRERSRVIQEDNIQRWQVLIDEYRRQNPLPLDPAAAEEAFKAIAKQALSLGLRQQGIERLKEETLNKWQAEYENPERGWSILERELDTETYEDLRIIFSIPSLRVFLVEIANFVERVRGQEATEALVITIATEIKSRLAAMLRVLQDPELIKRLRQNLSETKSTFRRDMASKSEQEVTSYQEEVAAIRKEITFYEAAAETLETTNLGTLLHEVRTALSALPDTLDFESWFKSFQRQGQEAVRIWTARHSKRIEPRRRYPYNSGDFFAGPATRLTETPPETFWFFDRPDGKSLTPLSQALTRKSARPKYTPASRRKPRPSTGQ